MSFNATKAKVVKFNGKNYTQWRAEMIAAFRFLPGLHNIIIGAATYDDDFHQDSSGAIILDSNGKGTHIATQTKLVVGTPIRAIRPKLVTSTDTQGITKASDDSIEAQRKYDDLNDPIVGLMSMYMESEYRHLIGNKTRATVIWDKIEKEFGKIGVIAGFTLFQQLFNFKMNGSKAIQPQISHMENL